MTTRLSGAGTGYAEDFSYPDAFFPQTARNERSSQDTFLTAEQPGLWMLISFSFESRLPQMFAFLFVCLGFFLLLPFLSFNKNLFLLVCCVFFFVSFFFLFFFFFIYLSR